MKLLEIPAYKEEKIMGIANKIDDIKIANNLREGRYDIRVLQVDDVTFDVTGGTTMNKVQAGIIIEKAYDNAKDKTGKARELSFLTSFPFGEIECLEFYASLSDVKNEKIAMTAEDFQEWEGRKTFAEFLEVPAPANTKADTLARFQKRQEAISSRELRCTVDVSASKGKNGKDQVNHKFYPLGQAPVDETETELKKPTAGTITAPPAV